MPDKHDQQRLTELYDTLMEKAHEVMERGQESGETLVKALKYAVDTVVEMGEYTREEAQRASDFLQRDLQDAGSYFQRTRKEFADWLHMDMELIEWTLIDMFMSVADRTRVELAKLSEQAEQASHYRTGETTGPGTLVCDNCGEKLHFKHSAHIPPCPKCHKSDFSRVSKED